MSREDRTIEQFCTRLAAIEGRQVHIIARPDRDNPGQGGCDAILDRGGQIFALEHTTIDCIVGQREDSARFRHVVVPLEEAIRSAYPDSWIEICVPSHAVPTGTDWSKVRDALLHGCVRAICDMTFGEFRREFQFEGVPFRVWITRRRSPRDPGCYVMRTAPGDLEAHMVDNMTSVIREKSEQLAPYRRDNLATILLLDSDEFVLTDRDSLAQAFRTAAERETPEEFDEVFIAQTFLNPIWVYPVKLNDRLYPHLPEFRRFFEAQYVLTYGESE
jgi:hypothetical protein